MVHMFWACEGTKILWSELNQWLSINLGIELHTSFEAVFMNIINVDINIVVLARLAAP